MPKVKDITKTQFFKVFAYLKEHPDQTRDEIQKGTGIPLPSVRRTLHELYSVGNLEGRRVYRLK